MRKILFYLSISSMIVSCSHGTGGDKQSELESLKKQQASLKEKILKLESEIAASDTSGTDSKSKLVAVTEMKPEIFTHYIEVQAKVEGDEDVTISAESMGNITGVNVTAGDHVEKGTVLATVDNRAISKAVAEVQTQLDLANDLYNRQKNLWDQKIGSEVQYLQAKTNKESLEKRMASVQEQLDMTRIKSPINGVVDEVFIKTGESMAPGVPAFRVVNLTSLRVTGEVAESFISKVKRGNDVIVYFPDMGKEIKTKLDYSGQVINRLNRTFNVEVRLNPKFGEFHPNMMAVLKIADYISPSTFILPVGSVQKSGEGEFVYVTNNENNKLVVKRKTVTSGINYNGLLEIKSGLQEGDRVITTGHQNVIEGDFIKL